MRFSRGIFATVVVLASVSFAGEKGGPLYLRVLQENGPTLEGHAKWKKDGVELETSAGPKTIAWRQISSLEEISPDAPAFDADAERDKAAFDERAKALDEKPADRPAKEPAELAQAWLKLA